MPSQCTPTKRWHERRWQIHSAEMTNWLDQRGGSHGDNLMASRVYLYTCARRSAWSGIMQGNICEMEIHERQLNSPLIKQLQFEPHGMYVFFGIHVDFVQTFNAPATRDYQYTDDELLKECRKMSNSIYYVLGNKSIVRIGKWKMKIENGLRTIHDFLNGIAIIDSSLWIPFF